jgi:hypothetical protein
MIPKDTHNLHAINRLRELMAQIGEIEDFGVVLGYGELHVWQVVIAENNAPITLEIDEDRQVSVLSSRLGTPEDGQIDLLNSLALEYSHLYTENGGARISRNKDDGCYSLIADYGLEALTRDDLGKVLRRFALMTAGWIEIILGRAEPGEDIKTDPTFIRA